jgi:hypothetical protein
LAAIYGRRLALEPALQANAALAALPEPDASAADDAAPAAAGGSEPSPSMEVIGGNEA